MSGIKSVLLAIHVATLRRDQAAAILTQMQQTQAQAQGQMAQLQSYADETQTRWSAAAQTSVTTELMIACIRPLGCSRGCCNRPQARWIAPAPNGWRPSTG